MVKQLSLKESEKLLRKYGITYPKSILAKSKDAALKAGKEIGFPVVMKVNSNKIIHKSDIGGVKASLYTLDAVEKAYSEIVKSTKCKEVMVQEMIEGHFVYIGMKRDPSFGPVMAFGMGGIYVEVFEDVSFRLAPTTKTEAMDMIRETKIYTVLRGIRGNKESDINKLAEIIKKASKIAVKEKHISEFDLNPIIVSPRGAKAVDARFIL